MGQLLQQYRNILVSAEELPVHQGEVIALVNGKAVKVAVAGSVGDLGSGHILNGCGHGFQDFLRLLLQIHSHHGGDTLGNSGGGNHHNFFFRQPHTLLGSHDDVLVVGEDKDHLGGNLVDLLENTLGGGVHGLSAGDNTVGSQIPEHGGQAVAGADREEAVALLGSSHAAVLGLVVILLQIVYALGLPPGHNVLILGAHVLNLGQLQGTVFLSLSEGAAGDVGVDVDFEGSIVLADDQAVTDAVQIGPQVSQIYIGTVLAHDKNGVEGKGDLLIGKDLEVRFLLLGLLVGDFRHILAPQGGQHAFQNDQIALAAGVYHAGLFQHRVHVSGLGQGVISHADSLLQHILHVAVFSGGFHSPLGSQPGYGKDGALGGLHHSAVGSGHALLHRGGQQGAVGGLMALETFAQTPEQKGEDHAGVAPCAPQ